MEVNVYNIKGEANLRKEAKSVVLRARLVVRKVAVVHVVVT